MMQNLDIGLNLDLKSGHPILEFTNTVSNHASEHPGETLFDYTDLISWMKTVGLLEEEQAKGLARNPMRLWQYLQNHWNCVSPSIESSLPKQKENLPQKATWPF